MSFFLQFLHSTVLADQLCCLDQFGAPHSLHRLSLYLGCFGFPVIFCFSHNWTSLTIFSFVAFLGLVLCFSRHWSSSSHLTDHTCIHVLDRLSFRLSCCFSVFSFPLHSLPLIFQSMIYQFGWCDVVEFTVLLCL